MSRRLQAAALAAFTAISSHTQADSISAALTPPLPSAPLPSSRLPDTKVSVPVLPMPLARANDIAPISVADIVARQANISNFGTACGPSLSVRPVESAMLDIEVIAPCQPSSVVTFSHSGLSFTQPLSMTGEARLRVPAMEANASVMAQLSDDTRLTSSAFVQNVDDYARVALQWDGDDPGELVVRAPKVLDGQLFTLGTSAGARDKVLHVFFRRVDDLTTSGIVRLSLRAGITENNCATGHSARVQRVVPGEPVTGYDLHITAPGCDAVGQSLELKNVMQDLKLSAK